MSQVGADIPFVGQAYEAPMLLQDAQRLINWFCEISQDKNSKEPIALLGTPGLNPLFTLFQSQGGNVRGAWVLPGGLQCLFVCGNVASLATVTVPATQNALAQFTITQLGLLLTNSGRVQMRDNGVLFNGNGGYVLLVDGQYVYYYRIAGTGTFTFTGGITSGSTTITLPGPLPTGLLMSTSAVLSDGGSNIPAGTYIASVNYSAPSLTMSAAATATVAAETITLTISSVGRLVDPGLPAAPSQISFIEGWLLINNDGTRTFQTNGPVPYTIMFPATFFALKDSSTDNLVTQYENNREYWAIGERTSEVWFNSGGANFSFSRLPGIGPQVGCAAKYSVSRFGPNLAWLARNEQGENIIIQTQQYAWERISTHAIEYAISQYPLVSDAIGDSYEEGGHWFYVLTFPTADVTWVYDGATKMWHQRLSYDPNTGMYHRCRGNIFVNFADVRMCGDYQSGQVHQQSRQIYTDAGNTIRRQRRTPHIWSRENRKRVFQSSIQVEFTPGVGLNVGQGVNPQAMLRWSNDGGRTWSNEHWTTIGAQGATFNRAIWRRLGKARDRIYELNFSDPVAADIIGATLFGEAEV